MAGYKNAKNVLPENLLDEVRRYHTGLLWLPVVGEDTVWRDREILALYQAGTRTEEIATLVHLSQRRVQQVIRGLRAGDGGAR